MNKERRILLVEDEPGMQLTVMDRLEGEGYKVDCAENGLDGWKMAEIGAYDVILLDVMLPGKNGLEICRDLRASGIKTPIMMVSAKTQVIDRVLGLKMGADDYLIKPFDLIELTARIEALLRRNGIEAETASDETSFSFGSFRIDYPDKAMYRGSEKVELSFQEYKLLEFFVRNRNKILSREKLLDGVWGYDEMPSTRTVDVHVAWLRQKLEADKANPVYIRTVRKYGYKFVSD
ncbi:MAG: response regulator transcription factor [Spirochaetales bacterium]|nr:response regulator transcription factor [Spirochaetales bacterium]